MIPNPKINLGIIQEVSRTRKPSPHLFKNKKLGAKKNTDTLLLFNLPSQPRFLPLDSPFLSHLLIMHQMSRLLHHLA